MNHYQQFDFYHNNYFITL